ncbi:MAG TPA: LysR family transcriptional regulator [Solirubrobacteraceae bacterium]|jgi:DNA-binding transcriptional LysR family regulator
MNLRQLEYFVAIAERGSLTAAAEALHVSQPSLSQQVRALERELGGELIERLPRGVRLTAAGQELLGEARATLRHAQRARWQVRRALDLEVGRLDVAVTTSAALGILPVVLRDWQQRHPEIEVSLLEFPHRRALDEAVRDGAGDVAVGSLPESWPGEVRRLGWEEFVVVLPDGDPLLDRDNVGLDQLADRRWVHFAPGHGLAEVVDLCCARAGFNPRVAVRTSQVAAAPRFAAGGLGPALVPEHIVPDALMHLARPAAPRLIRAVCAYTRGGWTPLTRAFLETLHDFPWGPKPRGAVDLA